MSIMNGVPQLIQSVGEARNSFIDEIKKITEQQAIWKPAPDVWNAIEITEHLYWAEHGGILGMWKTLHAIRSGAMERKLDSVHRDMPIEEIIWLTWKAKEIVPAVAAPRMGGTLIFWRHALGSLQTILEAFGNDLKPEELRLQAHPHPISGPMDFQQRLEFLAFHIHRHKGQVMDLSKEFS
jgi:DinB superfamily